MTSLQSDTCREMRRLYIFGAGGHGRELAWLATQTWGNDVDLTFVVDKLEFLTGPVNGIDVKLLEDLEPDRARFVAGVGSSNLRRSIVKKFEEKGIRPATLVHPHIELSSHLLIGDGVVVCAGVILTTNTVLDNHVHINIGCTISHDVHVGEFSTLAPGVTVCGHVDIGADVFVGAGVTIINGNLNRRIKIGDGSMIAAGSCVTRSVEARNMVAGVPAVTKKRLAN